MRILQLTHKFPYPYHDGGTIAVKSLAEGLSKAGVELDLFSLNTDKHLVTESQIEDFKTHSVYKIINSNQLDTTESKSGAVWSIFFGKESYFINRFYKAEVAIDLKAQLNAVKYDAIIIESLYMFPYFDELRKAVPNIPIVLRAHNIEFELRSRQRQEEGSWIRRLYLKSEIRKLKADLIATVSDREAQKIENELKGDHVITIPIGMSVSEIYKDKRTSNLFKIGFIGSLDWSPNINGLKWFVSKVWSQCNSAKIIECHIAGAYAGSDVQFLKEESLNYIGQVESSADFMLTLDLLIVPLFSGSGTRVKILEAMSLGVPVLSTSLGAEGIDVHPGSNILVADTQWDWIGIVKDYSKKSDALIEIGRNAQELIREKYNIEAIGKKLKKEIDDLVQNKDKSKIK